jgi:pantoate--beta-alanine ligase
MQTVSNAFEYEGLHRQWTGRRIALVPTMGALHDGHFALIKRAKQLADIVVVSIFVNPLQFGPQEDYTRYPRPLGQDLAACRDLGVHAALTPSVEAMYPGGMENTTIVKPPDSLSRILCGQYRPGHFTGVTTVVLKLFSMVRPNLAIFGEKDAQQLAIIRKMVKDLQLPIDIFGHPIIRESSGLALSSRNQYLKDDKERQAALGLIRILRRIRQEAQERPNAKAVKTLDEVSQEVLAEMGEVGAFLRLQYLEALHKETLAPVETLSADTKVLIAGYVGDVRLIDNMDIA